MAENRNSACVGRHSTANMPGLVNPVDKQLEFD